MGAHHFAALLAGLAACGGGGGGGEIDGGRGPSSGGSDGSASAQCSFTCSTGEKQACLSGAGCARVCDCAYKCAHDDCACIRGCF